MAVLIVGFFVIVVLYIVGLIEKTACYFIPPLKYVKWALVIVCGIFFIRFIGYSNGITSQPEDMADALAQLTIHHGTFDHITAFACGILYCVAIVVIKLLYVPLTMMFQIFEIAREPDEPKKQIMNEEKEEEQTLNSLSLQ